MTIEINELLRSGSGDDGANKSFELMFHAKGSDSYDDIASAISGSSIPVIYRGLPRQGIEPEPIGGGHWYLRARYSQAVESQPPLQAGDPPRITWQSVSTTVKRSHATVVNVYPAAGITAPNNGTAINVTDDGVEGVDVETAYSRMTIKEVITSAQATTAYAKTLAKYAKIKPVNNATWNGFSAGEARFIDFVLESRSDGDWDLTRIFDVDENVTGGTYAGVTGITKNAHDYMWALMERKEDATAKRVVESTVCVTVHQIYPPIAFSLLEP